MTNATTHNCPDCQTINTTVLKETSLLVCQNCGSIIIHNVKGKLKPDPVKIPSDWSFIQLYTTGEYNEQGFTIVGRIRLQLRNDYKNLWCCALANGNHIWLVESFASFIVLAVQRQVFKQDVRYLRAGESISLGQQKVNGEFVEKCEDISYEGEIGDWNLFHPGFFFIQASSKNNNITAVFTIDGYDYIEYLLGEKVLIEKLKLKNVILWNEWK